MNRLHENLWLLAATIVAVITTVFTLSYMATDPGHVIVDLGGDGAKNIFTYLYHSMFGHGYWFQGMNYPYGEHVVYTDGQPLLSVTFASLKGVSATTALSTMWTLISFSFVLAIIYTYKVLREFNVTPLLAIIAAALITIFSPQMLRLRSHYALSYACVIPMLFYWTIQYYRAYKLKYCIYFFALGCIMAFLHPYYVGLLFVWVMVFALGYVLLTKDDLLKKTRYVLPLIASVVCVMAVVALTMRLTDPITDRPKTPYIDAYELFTRPRQIITSAWSPIWVFAKEKSWIWLIADGGEGYAYIGLASLFTLAALFFVLTRKALKNKSIKVFMEEAGMPPIWLFIAFALLLFSMGFPFTLYLPSIKYFFVLKQFRSLGRFSWIFYHITSVYTIVLVCHFFKNKLAQRNYALGYGVLLAFFALWWYEASGYIKASRRMANEGKYNYGVYFSVHENNWEKFLQENHHNKNDFQAICMLPFFHIGTEKLWLSNKKTDWVVSLGTRASLQLQLPIIDVMMSRSSWSQAEKQVKIAGGPYTEKSSLTDMHSSKPFLLMHFEEDSLDEDQKYLLLSAEYIGHHAQCNVYACYPDRILENDKKHIDSFKAVLPSLPPGDTWLGSTLPHYLKHFDEMSDNQGIFGTGGSPTISLDSATIATIPVNISTDSARYELSCWFLLDRDNFYSPYISFKLLDASGNAIASYDMLTNKSVDNNGLWFRANKYFTVTAPCHSIQCILQNPAKQSYKVMNELMLRPVEATVISKSLHGKPMINNHIFH